MPDSVPLRSISWRWLLMSAIGLMLAGCALLAPHPSIDNANLLLGNPSGASSSPGSANNYLIARPQYVMSYNRERGTANWVSWQLNQAWLGDLPRQPFAPDQSLPQGWYEVLPDDYTGTGFDRGHLVPAADRNKTPEDSRAVFLMSNILPQAPDNNRGPWEKLERYCRELAGQGKELYVVAGGVGSGGLGEKGQRRTIARGKVNVPANLWKVVVVFDRPGATLANLTENTRVIAVLMPNRQGIKEQDWRSFRTSVDAIEQATDYNLLSNVPDNIQKVVEAKVDSGK